MTLADTRGRWPSRGAALGVLVFFLAVATLHVLRPEVDPTRWGMSFYAVGPFAALMTTAFITLGLSLLALATAFVLATGPEVRSRLGVALLAVCGVALLGVALFPSNAVPPVTRTDFAHVVASMIFFFAFALASGFISWPLPPGRSRIIAIGLAAGFSTSLFLMLAGAWRVHGLLQRIAVGFILAWVVTLAVHLDRQLGTRTRRG